MSRLAAATLSMLFTCGCSCDDSEQRAASPKPSVSPSAELATIEAEQLAALEAGPDEEPAALVSTPAASGSAAEVGAAKALTAEACAMKPRCASDGYCGVKAKRCAAVTDEHCVAAAICREEGKCSAKHGVCVAGAASQCTSSANCQKLGHCGLRHDECLPTEGAHCKASEICSRHERCSLEEGRCVR